MTTRRVDDPEDGLSSSLSALVTVIVPTRNEEEDIGVALTAIGTQDHPLGEIEVIVVDSGSADHTLAVARRQLQTMPFARSVIIENPGGSTPSNLNVGLAAAQGRYICRVDARSIIQPHHVRTCVQVLERDQSIQVVGGAQVARARDDRSQSIGIARALNNRWAMGFSKYRRGAPSGPADTVYLGSFRTNEIREHGGWDERFATNQDFELNRRMGRSGTVWFESSLRVGYHPRRKVRELFAQYLRFGAWKVDYWLITQDRPRSRQLVLIAAPPAAGALAIMFGLHRRKNFVLMGIGVAAGAIAVESAGASEPQGSPRAHLWGVAALAAIVTGWTLGIWRSLLRMVVR